MSLKNRIKKMFGVCLSEEPERSEELSELEEINDGPQFLGQCNFVLLSNGQIHILCSWADNTKEVGELYGQLLYYINSGELKPQIQQVLIEQCKQDFSCKPFVQTALESWKKLESDKPAKDPRAVFALPHEE